MSAACRARRTCWRCSKRAKPGRASTRRRSRRGSPPPRGAEGDKPPQTGAHRDLLDHPDAAERLIQGRGGTSWFAREAVPCCIGPVTYRDRHPLDTELKNLAAARAAAHPGEAFMNAAS